MQNSAIRWLLPALTLGTGLLYAADPVCLVTDFATNTSPFESSGQFVTSQYHSAPGCMGVASQAVLTKDAGWPYQVSAVFYAGQSYPSFPMNFRFMMKAGSFTGGTTPFSIDIVARQHPGNPGWLGAYVGRRAIVKTATTANWFVGIDTVITDFGATVDQNGKTFRELYNGPVILYFAVVPGDRKVYVDDIHIADASTTPNVLTRLTVRPAAPVSTGALKIYAPNGRAYRSNALPTAANLVLSAMGGDARSCVTVR